MRDIMVGDRVEIMPRGWDRAAFGTVIRVVEDDAVIWRRTAGIWIEAPGPGILIWILPSQGGFKVVGRLESAHARAELLSRAFERFNERIGAEELEGWGL